jgi:hypothetical protein
MGSCCSKNESIEYETMTYGWTPYTPSPIATPEKRDPSPPVAIRRW